jgi:hypothetical protein
MNLAEIVMLSLFVVGAWIAANALDHIADELTQIRKLLADEEE